MIWFFSRDKRSLTIETRYDNVTHEFVAIVTGLAGPTITKRFPTPDAFREWLLGMEHELTADHWTPDGPPHILPDGWRDTPWKL